MREISAAELRIIVNELGEMAPCSFRNFHEVGECAFLIEFEKERKRRGIYVKLNKALCETKFFEQEKAQTGFAHALKKKLEGSRLTATKQHDSDRVVVFEFDGAEKKRLVFEMLGKGNAVLTNSKGIVELSYRGKAYKERPTAVGSAYEFPKSTGVEYDAVDHKKAGEIVVGIRHEEKKLIVALAEKVNLGPVYLEDIILNTNLNPKKSAEEQLDDDPASLAALWKELFSFFEKIKSPKPLAYLEDGNYVDFSAFPLLKYGGKEAKEFGTLSELLDALYLEERSAVKDAGNEAEREELRKSIEKLNAQIVELKQKSGSYAETGNKIFEHMSDINMAIDHIRKSKGRGGEGISFGRIRIKSADAKNKTAVMEIGGRDA